MEEGIKVAGLLASEVFCFTFDFDEWPSTHTIDDTLVRPFNGQILDLMYAYRDVFNEDKFEIPDEMQED